MRRIVITGLFVLLLPLPFISLLGCGGSESGTQQISEKTSPDAEVEAGAKTGKGGKPLKRASKVRD